MKEYEELLLNVDDVGKSFDDKLSTIEESASLECQVKYLIAIRVMELYHKTSMVKISGAFHKTLRI